MCRIITIKILQMSNNFVEQDLFLYYLKIYLFNYLIY